MAQTLSRISDSAPAHYPAAPNQSAKSNSHTECKLSARIRGFCSHQSLSAGACFCLSNIFPVQIIVRPAQVLPSEIQGLGFGTSPQKTHLNGKTAR
jgi:hypothetical protein